MSEVMSRLCLGGCARTGFAVPRFSESGFMSEMFETVPLN